MIKKKRDAKWQNDFIRRNYDRLNILVPSGHKATIEEAAQDARESVNLFVNRSILARLGLEEWPKND